MSKPQELYRKILLSDNIKADTVKGINETIMNINHDDNLKEADYKDWDRKPINLFINSFGGSVYDGLALVDVIKQSKTPVHTISIGSSMSMGFWIYLAGHKRYVGENATLMFHDITTWVWDKTEAIKQELNEVLRLQKIICNEVTSTSMVKQETLDDYITRKAEWYIPADEAIKLKLADGYYKED
jgi:ATP-dependent Clp protease protease subunit